MTDPLGTFIVRTLLRYFRAGESIAVHDVSPRMADREILVLHWAVSPVVSDLAQYLHQHLHEVQASLEHRSIAESGTVRGRLDSSATALLQGRTADPSLFVFYEPFRTHATGPNRVLAWTLTYATQMARRFRQMLPADAAYHTRTVATLRHLDDVRRILPRLGSAYLNAPSSNDVRMARSSRLRLYRKAADAFDLLRAIERLDRAAIETLLNSTLVGPLERWRQFELALALAMAEAVAGVTGSEARLRFVLPGAADVLIDVGKYALRWQRAGPTFLRPSLGHWEKRVAKVLADYGLSPGYDRPDVVMYEIESGRTIAVGEAKYFEGEDWSDRLRDAVGQVVTYARGHEASQGDADSIINHSIIALWSADGQAPKATLRTPFVATFADLRLGLDAWAERAVNGGRSAPPSTGNGTSSSAPVANTAGG